MTENARLIHTRLAKGCLLCASNVRTRTGPVYISERSATHPSAAFPCWLHPWTSQQAWNLRESFADPRRWRAQDIKRDLIDPSASIVEPSRGEIRRPAWELCARAICVTFADLDLLLNWRRPDPVCAHEQQLTSRPYARVKRYSA